MTAATDAGPWEPLLTVTTPWSALDAIVRRQVRVALADLRAQLEVSTAWDEAALEQALRLAEPIIAARWRLCVETAWWELQRLAGREH